MSEWILEKKIKSLNFRNYYSGASLIFLLNDLEEFLALFSKVISKLKQQEEEVVKNRERFYSPDSILRIISTWLILFERYKEEIKRLLNELPHGVAASHIDSIFQIVDELSNQSTEMIDFNSDYLYEKKLKDENYRDFLNEIIWNGNQVIGNKDRLGSLSYRLKAFVGEEIKSKQKINNKSIQKIDVPPGTRWAQVRVYFQDKEGLAIYVDGKSKGYHGFAKIGFSKFNKKPNRLWLTLANFAKREGIIPPENRGIDVQGKSQKDISDLRKHLKKIFPDIAGEPIDSYIKKIGYKTNFKIDLINMDTYDEIKEWTRKSQYSPQDMSKEDYYENIQKSPGKKR